MPDRTKIKIIDDVSLRSEILMLYERVDQVIVAKWAISLTKHVFQAAGLDYRAYDAVVEGFSIHERWQIGDASVHQVRQAAFAVHKLARACTSDLEITVLRTAGQTIASGHMKEHAMVASDYAIKVIGLLHDNDIHHITVERKWQLATLRNFVANSQPQSCFGSQTRLSIASRNP